MKYFGNIEWSNISKNLLGIPRPYFNIPEYLQKKPATPELMKKNFYLHKVVPMPWQSIPVFDGKQQLQLDMQNEDRCVAEGLCPFCGIKIKDSEDCVRWKTNDAVVTREGPKIYSDIMPFHILCMKQARIFCPFMRQTKKHEFEYGKCNILKANALRCIAIVELNKKNNPLN